MTEEQKPQNIRFIVTGFGPFGGVPENPTTVLTNRLVAHLEANAPQLACRTETALIETSAVGAREGVQKINAKLNNETAPSTTCTTVLLHLGVNYKGETFQLERCAYNEASFRIPDERGFQPQEESILGENVVVGSCLETLLEVTSLVDQLNRRDRQDAEEISTTTTNNRSVPVVASSDPGRFVCNYTYCYSLDAFQCSTSVKRCSNNRCLFLHVPPFTVASEEEQLAFVTRLLSLLYDQVSSPA